MENTKRNIFLQKNTLFGLCIGLSFIVISYLYYKTGRDITTNPRFNNLLLLLSIAGAFIGTRKYREEVLAGKLSYGYALGCCLYLIGVAAVSYSVYLYFLYSAHPELVKSYVTTLEAAFQEIYGQNNPAANLNNLLQTLITPLFLALANIFSQLLTGIIFSLFLAGLLRKEKK